MNWGCKCSINHALCFQLHSITWTSFGRFWFPQSLCLWGLCSMTQLAYYCHSLLPQCTVWFQHLCSAKSAVTHPSIFQPSKFCWQSGLLSFLLLLSCFCIKAHNWIPYSFLPLSKGIQGWSRDKHMWSVCLLHLQISFLCFFKSLSHLWILPSGNSVKVTNLLLWIKTRHFSHFEFLKKYPLSNTIQ